MDICITHAVSIIEASILKQELIRCAGKYPVGGLLMWWKQILVGIGSKNLTNEFRIGEHKLEKSTK